MTGPTEQSGTVESSIDRMPIFYRKWQSVDPKAIVIIIHGMSEHSGRYSDFARTLSDELQATVVATDHRAHGRTACPVEGNLSALGTFATNTPISKLDCLETMATDILDVVNSSELNPKLPILLFGHSMGSLIARTVMRIAPSDTRDRIRGVVLSGVPTVPAAYERFPLLVLVNSAILIGKGRDTLHHFIMDKFDNAVRKLKHDKSLPRSCFLSTVPSQIESFNADPLCGQTVDLHVWKSIRATLIDLMKPAEFFSSWRDVENKSPILFISGKDDPVCLGGKTAASDAKGMRSLGFQTDEVYLDSCLHEFIHEEPQVRQKGINETLSWFRSKL